MAKRTNNSRNQIELQKSPRAQHALNDRTKTVQHIHVDKNVDQKIVRENRTQKIGPMPVHQQSPAHRKVLTHELEPGGVGPSQKHRHVDNND